jgi:hypothetical protein
MDNSKIIPALLGTIGSTIAGKLRSSECDIAIGLEDLTITSAHLTTDGEGDVLIVLLSNGQSLKVRAKPFGRASK